MLLAQVMLQKFKAIYVNRSEDPENGVSGKLWDKAYQTL